MTIRYCLGFMFSNRTPVVLLLRKQHPEWQKDKLNGVGGKVRVDKGESDLAAMVREFKEETGIDTVESDWDHYANLLGPMVWVDQPNSMEKVLEREYVVLCYRAVGLIEKAQMMTDERPELVMYKTIPLKDDIIWNMNWLVPLALDKTIREPVDVKFRCAQEEKRIQEQMNKR